MEVEKPKKRNKTPATPARRGLNGSVSLEPLSSPSDDNPVNNTPDSTQHSTNDRRSTLREHARAEISEYVETSDSSDDEAEDHRTATRAGFKATEMEEFEKEYFPEYVDYENDFINARNYILMMWKRNPSKFLTWNKVTSGMSVCPTSQFNFYLKIPPMA